MLAAKVPLKDAEAVKRFMIDNSLFDNEYAVVKDGKHIFYPIKVKGGIEERFPSVVVVKMDLPGHTSQSNYKELLRGSLSDEESSLLPSSYDVVGDIVILDLPKDLVKSERMIADALLKTHKNIKTVLKKRGIHEGEFRTQPLDYVAGEDRKETIYTENGVRLMLDVEQVYFSPRLSTERKRVYSQVRKGEDVLVMFAGCGPYALTISKNTQAKSIVGVEKNPVASNYFEKNIRLNKVRNVTSINGDVREEIPRLGRTFDRIAMPLPKDASDFLDVAFPVSRKGTVIHLYDFAHENDIEDVRKKIERICREHDVDARIERIVKCGQYSPGKFRLCADIRIL